MRRDDEVEYRYAEQRGGRQRGVRERERIRRGEGARGRRRRERARGGTSAQRLVELVGEMRGLPDDEIF